MLPRKRPPPGEAAASIRFLVLLVVAAVLARSLVAAPFSIPSESMLPRLLVGDYLLVAKWPYGWSRHSFPFSLAPIAGRIGGAPPLRGDVIVFKNPGDNRTDYIKRLIGLPGDRIRMAGGALILNGAPVPRLRVADFLDPVTPNSPCHPEPGLRIALARAGGRAVCRYPRYRETLPGGFSYDILDIGATAGDDTAVFTVPPGHYFLMGDNRDRSADSRFPAEAGGGIGFVPAENLVGRAMVTFFSTDGSAGWLSPRGWPAATRWGRIGEGFAAHSSASPPPRAAR